MGLRVDWLTCGVDLEVQVRTGGLASVTDLGDRLANLNILARGDEVAVVVTVGGDYPVGVLDADPQAVAGGRPGVDDGAVGGRDDKGAGGCGDARRARGGASGVWWAPVADDTIDLKRAAPLTSGDLYSGRIASNGRGTEVLLAFATGASSAEFTGAIIDPVPVGWVDGTLTTG